jgi:transketolase
MGFLPGITTPAGMTHQSIEDIAVMRTIPNMTVLETGDAKEVESVCKAADSIDGPVYCRVLRGAVPRFFNTPLKVGEIRELDKGDDLLIITSGITTEEALRARSAIQNAGIAIQHIHLHTIKPINEEILVDQIQKVKHGVITMENHLINGGTGSIMADIIAKYGLAKKLIKLGLNDTFAHGGSRSYLAKYYGLDAYSLIKAIEKLMKIKTGIKEENLDKVRIEDVHSLSKAEAL